jgi:hypothetical protein
MPAEEIKSESAKKNEDWMNSKWRPAMGWMYMVVCMFDMVAFPVLWSLLQATTHGSVNTQWNPLTLQGAGLFHIAMGAILGIAAYGRTQEKMAGANNGGIAPPTPAPSFGSPAPTPAFGGAPASPAPVFGASKSTPTPAPAFGAPVQPPHPEI